MSITIRNSQNYTDSQSNICEVLLDYSKNVTYLAEHFADAKCSCGGTQFRLMIDDNEGVATRSCTSCGKEHPIGDSAEYLEDAELEECECTCGNNSFEITVGVSLYQDSEDVKWLYIGCRCPKCQLTGCYADWKNEYENYKELLERI
ncbi:MAG: hypothetical protein GY794_04075 [bacterium]|nr:hypothetical protein [bacterium]